jgi:hypothetical protein
VAVEKYSKKKEAGRRLFGAYKSSLIIAEASPLRVLFNPPWPSVQSYLVRLNVHFYLRKFCLPKGLIGSGGALQPPISIANTQLKPNGPPQFLNVELVVCSLGFGFVYLTYHPPMSLPLPSLRVSLRLQVACRLEATNEKAARLENLVNFVFRNAHFGVL